MKPYFIKEESLLNREPKLRDIFIQCRLFNLEISRETVLQTMFSGMLLRAL